MIKFTEKESAACFNEMAEQFYKANFGRMTKPDFELMMFHFFYEKLISERTEEGLIDYSKCSDYRISQQLGITQQKVRNLKIRNQLVYPVQYDWKKELARLIEHARFDQETRKVSVNIPDPNLFIEIRNFIEEKGAYVDLQLNPKLLQLRAEYFIDLIVELETDNVVKKKIHATIKKQFEKSQKKNATFDEKHIGKSMLEAAVDVTTVAANIHSLVSPANAVGKALTGLLVKGKQLLMPEEDNVPE